MEWVSVKLILAGHVLDLTNVLYAPEIVHNLMSIRKLTECGHKMHCEGTNVLLNVTMAIIFLILLMEISMS